jgi:hypothetical protein
MKANSRTFRSYTLLEMLTVVGLMGTFLLVSGPLAVHLIYAVNGRTRTYDQLFRVSRIDDRIQSDLQGPAGGPAPQVLAVEPGRLLIRSSGQTIEYRIGSGEIERIESSAPKSPETKGWKIPYAALSFSRESGKPGAVLVGLHWRLGRPGDRSTLPRKLAVDLAFAAAEPLKQEGKLK